MLNFSDTERAALFLAGQQLGRDLGPVPHGVHAVDVLVRVRGTLRSREGYIEPLLEVDLVAGCEEPPQEVEDCSPPWALFVDGSEASRHPTEEAAERMADAVLEAQPNVSITVVRLPWSTR